MWYLVEVLGFKEFVHKRLSLNLGFTEMPHLLHQPKKYRTWIKSSGDCMFHERFEMQCKEKVSFTWEEDTELCLL